MAEAEEFLSHRGCQTPVSGHNITSTLNNLFKRRIFILSFNWIGKTSIGQTAWKM